jgi:hypothetical protein
MTDGRRAIRFRLVSDDDLRAIAELQLSAAISRPAETELRRLLDRLPPGPARYEGEGHYFANVTGYLREEQGIVEQEDDLAERLNEAVGSMWVLYRPTPETLRLLDPARYTVEELRSAFEEGEFSDPRSGEQMLEAIRVLRANVEAAGDRTLLVEL